MISVGKVVTVEGKRMKVLGITVTAGERFYFLDSDGSVVYYPAKVVEDKNFYYNQRRK